MNWETQFILHPTLFNNFVLRNAYFEVCKYVSHKSFAWRIILHIQILFQYLLLSVLLISQLSFKTLITVKDVSHGLTRLRDVILDILDL